MTIEFPCPSCQKPVRTPDSAAKKKGKCPHCGTIVLIPQPDPELVAPDRPSLAAPQPMPQPAVIEFPCTACHELVRTPPSAAGKKGKCPHCGAVNQIPGQSVVATTTAKPEPEPEPKPPPASKPPATPPKPAPATAPSPPPKPKAADPAKPAPAKTAPKPTAPLPKAKPLSEKPAAPGPAKPKPKAGEQVPTLTPRGNNPWGPASAGAPPAVSPLDDPFILDQPGQPAANPGGLTPLGSDSDPFGGGGLAPLGPPTSDPFDGLTPIGSATNDPFSGLGPAPSDPVGGLAPLGGSGGGGFQDPLAGLPSVASPAPAFSPFSPSPAANPYQSPAATSGYRRPQGSGPAPMILAVSSLIMSIAGLLSCFCCLFMPFPAISLLLGIIALCIRPDPPAKITAIIGIILSLLVVVLLLAGIVLYGAALFADPQLRRALR